MIKFSQATRIRRCNGIEMMHLLSGNMPHVHIDDIVAYTEGISSHFQKINKAAIVACYQMTLAASRLTRTSRPQRLWEGHSLAREGNSVVLGGPR